MSNMIRPAASRVGDPGQTLRCREGAWLCSSAPMFGCVDGPLCIHRIYVCLWRRRKPLRMGDENFKPRKLPHGFWFAVSLRWVGRKVVALR